MAALRDLSAKVMKMVLLCTVMVSISLEYNGANDYQFGKMNSFHNQRSGHILVKSNSMDLNLLKTVISQLSNPLSPTRTGKPIIISLIPSNSRQPISPSYPSDSRDPISPSYPSDSRDPISPSYPSNSREPISPSYPSDSRDRISPSYPSDSRDPISPSYPSDSRDPISPSYPSNSRDPISPSYPSNSIDLNLLKNLISQLSNPLSPTRPSYPSNSREPISPSYPSNSRDPISPSYPSDSRDPISPSYPSDSRDPISPSYPSNSREPISPSYPSNSREPMSPSYPSDSREPISPSEPNNSSDLGNFRDRSQGNNTSSSSRPCDCGKNNKVLQSRIVGGKITGKNVYIWVVLVRIIKGLGLLSSCGGSIITVFHVLTAAHCTVGILAYYITVYTGMHNSNQIDERVGIYRVAENIVHDRYDFDRAVYDIAVLVTEEKIIFGPYVGPICLPKKEFDLNGHQLKAIGWGLTKEIVEDNILREVNITFVSLDICRQYKRTLTKENTQICTYGYKKGVCDGDSGGGLFHYDSSNDRYVQVGLLSYITFLENDPIQCGSGLPTVSTAVYPFMDWIRFQVSKIKPEVTVYEVDY